MALELDSPNIGYIMDVLKERGMDVESKVLALPVPVRAVLYVAIASLTLYSMVFGSGGGFMYANY